MSGIPEFVQWSSDRFNSIDRQIRNTDRSDRRNRANRMVACCVADCDVVDNETGEVCFEYGDILLPCDLERIEALNAAIFDNGDSGHRREWERGSIEVGAALCNLVLLIALIVFLVIVAIGVRLPFDLLWLPKQMGF